MGPQSIVVILPVLLWLLFGICSINNGFDRTDDTNSNDAVPMAGTQVLWASGL